MYNLGIMDKAMGSSKQNIGKVLQSETKHDKINNNKQSAENEQGIRLRDGSERTNGNIQEILADAYAGIDVLETVSETEVRATEFSEGNQQSTLDVIPHLKEILNNSICLAVERVVHTDNKRTSLFGYRLYNFYWYQDGKNKTLHCLVSTVVQNTDNAEGHVFKNIENVTIDRGLPGKNTDMSASVNGDTYSISQLYQFVKGVDRKDGGIKYSQIEKQTISISHKNQNVNKKDTADRINGLERPKPNEGYALTNGISNNSISNPGTNVNKNSKQFNFSPRCGLLFLFRKKFAMLTIS